MGATGTTLTRRTHVKLQARPHTTAAKNGHGRTHQIQTHRILQLSACATRRSCPVPPCTRAGPGVDGRLGVLAAHHIGCIDVRSTNTGATDAVRCDESGSMAQKHHAGAGAVAMLLGRQRAGPSAVAVAVATTLKSSQPTPPHGSTYGGGSVGDAREKRPAVAGRAWEGAGDRRGRVASEWAAARDARASKKAQASMKGQSLSPCPQLTAPCSPGWKTWRKGVNSDCN